MYSHNIIISKEVWNPLGELLAVLAVLCQDRKENHSSQEHPTPFGLTLLHPCKCVDFAARLMLFSPSV